MNFVSKKLSNGLEVIGEVRPDSPSVSIGYFVRTGARDETQEVSGVSHFLEHMMSRELRNVRHLILATASGS